MVSCGVVGSTVLMIVDGSVGHIVVSCEEVVPAASVTVGQIVVS